MLIVFNIMFLARRPGDDERDSRGAEPPGDGELHELRDAQVRGRGARAVPALRPLLADGAQPLDEVSAANMIL